jgi:hypothetical protein
MFVDFKVIKIYGIEDFRIIIKYGEKACHYRQTDINEHSSRSNHIAFSKM